MQPCTLDELKWNVLGLHWLQVAPVAKSYKHNNQVSKNYGETKLEKLVVTTHQWRKTFQT